MKKITLLLIVLGITSNLLAQGKDSCNLWSEYKNHTKGYDTIRIKAKYLGVNENIYYHPYLASDQDNLFYKNLQSKYRLNLCLGFQSISCDKGYCYPLVYKSKYDYTLFHRRNKKNEYEDWQEGQSVELTLVRYNRYFENSSDLITLVIDIVPLKGILPVKNLELDSSYLKKNPKVIY